MFVRMYVLTVCNTIKMITETCNWRLSLTHNIDKSATAMWIKLVTDHFIDHYIPLI
jgi:hypothetical protein